MALFNEKDYGLTISEEMSDFIKRYTNTQDRADVNRTTGIGTSTIRDVVYRNNPLTENNSPAIIELVRISLERCDDVIAEAEDYRKQFALEV